MNAYTHKNLGEIEDSAAKHGSGEIMEVRFARGDLDATETGLAHHQLKPNQRQPFGHKHDDAEEVFVVLAGSGRVKLDDEVLELTRLDALRIAPDVMRQFEAGEDGLEMIVFGPHHDADGEIVPGWWAEGA